MRGPSLSCVDRQGHREAEGNEGHGEPLRRTKCVRGLGDDGLVTNRTGNVAGSVAGHEEWDRANVEARRGSTDRNERANLDSLEERSAKERANQTYLHEIDGLIS